MFLAHINSEDSELGIFDINPKPTSDSESSESREEKELLLCFRPFHIGKKVGEDLRFPPHQISESSNANGSGENGSGDITSSNKSSSGNGSGENGSGDRTSSNKSSSGNDEKNMMNSGSDAPSSETQLNVGSDASKGLHHAKKRSLEVCEAGATKMSEPSKKQCIEGNEQNTAMSMDR